MGRLLEALKQADSQRGRPVNGNGDLHPYSPERLPAPEAEIIGPEIIPYIEVGGPRNCIDASPDVLACPGPVIPPLTPPSQGRERGSLTPLSQGGERKGTSGVSSLAPAIAPPSPGFWKVYFRYLYADQAGLKRARKLAGELVAFHQPEHPVSDQYRDLLGVLEGQLPLGRSQVLLFTASAPGEGTTTVLLNLAITAAREGGKRVAVVDANLRRPAIAGRLGLALSPGLREVLARTVPISHAVQDTALANLRALAAGQPGPDLWLPLDGLRGTLHHLRDSFDLVLVDAPPWIEGRETASLAAACDAVYLIVHQQHEQDSPDPASLLRQPPANLQGCIVTLE